jgi:hypothetical protein
MHVHRDTMTLEFVGDNEYVSRKTLFVNHKLLLSNKAIAVNFVYSLTVLSFLFLISKKKMAIFHLF